MNITNNIKLLLTDYSFLNYIKLNHEIKAIYIGGSRMFDLNTENSDYDLNIVVADPYFKSTFDNLNVPILYAKYFDTSIHWYYVSKDFKINNNYSNYIYDIWMCQLYYGLKNKNNIIKIYDKNYFNSYLEYVQNNYDKAIINVKNKYKGIISYLINEKNYLKIINKINKTCYFLCLLGYLVTDTPINKSALLKIKKYAKRNYTRFSYETKKSLTDEDIHMIDEFKSILKKLYEYLQTI